MNPISTNLKAAALVPGLPHILKPELNEGYQALANALGELGDQFAAAGVERVVYYSTQWLSVLGQSFQAKGDLKGEHVDENWHDLPNLPFSFRVDQAFARRMAERASDSGFQTKLVDYEGFPVDTGTIVADTLMNKGRFSTNMVSCCVYSDGAETAKLAGIVRDALDEDGTPTAVVVVSMLSGRFFTTEIDMREDAFGDPKDDEWNRKVLGLLEKGDYAVLGKVLPDYARECKVDMGFKALNFLEGVGATAENRPGKTRAYAPIYGTGAAVVSF